MRIGHRTYACGVSRFDTKAGLVLGTDQALVVDTFHHPREAMTLRQEAESQGRATGWVFYTHWHGDHTWGSHAVEGVVISSDKCAGHME